MTANRISLDPDISCQNLDNSSSGDVVDLTGDDEDRDTEMGDSTGVSVSLSGGISSKGKKSQESNIGGSDNTRDRASEVKRYLVKLSEESGEVFLGEAGK
ncbi:hypothetical protein Tco_1098231 [Tanacetum coccineum]